MKPCVCHKVKRSLSFSTSSDKIVCWCGLINHNLNRCKEKKSEYNLESEYTMNRVPVRVDGYFWKCSLKDALDHSKSLENLISPDQLNSTLYFVSNYLIGPYIGFGSTSHVRQALRKNIYEDSWDRVALKWYYSSCILNKRIPVFDENGYSHCINGWDRVLWDPEHNIWIVAMEYGVNTLAKYDLGIQAYSQSDSFSNSDSFTSINEKGAKVITRQLFNALNYLQNEKGIIHKDLKPENIILSHPIPNEWKQLNNLHNKDIPPKQLDNNLTDIISYIHNNFEFENMSSCTEDFLWTEESFDDDLDQESNDKFNEYPIENIYDERLSNDNQENIYRSLDETIMHRHSNRNTKSSDYFCFCCALRQIEGMTTKFDVNPSMCEPFYHLVDRNKPKDKIMECSCCEINISVNLHNDRESPHYNKISNSINTVSEYPLVKMIDFNLSVQTFKNNFPIYDADGTKHFTPPECFALSIDDNNSNYKNGASRDIWSIGCILYTIIIGELPFRSQNPLELIHNILSGTLRYPPWLSQDLKNFFERILDKNPEKRITIREALFHEWLQDVSNQA